MAAEEFTHSELDNFLKELTEENLPLSPHTSDDPFYLAQLRQKELETLQNLHYIPLGDENLATNETVASILGERAQSEVNSLIPNGLRSKRVAISTFLLIALETQTQKHIPYSDDEEILVSGLFNIFDFDKAGRPKSLVVPLYQPRFLKPRILRDVEADMVTIPVLNVHDWELDLSA